MGLTTYHQLWLPVLLCIRLHLFQDGNNHIKTWPFCCIFIHAYLYHSWHVMWNSRRNLDAQTFQRHLVNSQTTIMMLRLQNTPTLTHILLDGNKWPSSVLMPSLIHRVVLSDSRLIVLVDDVISVLTLSVIADLFCSDYDCLLVLLIYFRVALDILSGPGWNPAKFSYPAPAGYGRRIWGRIWPSFDASASVIGQEFIVLQIW